MSYQFDFGAVLADGRLLLRGTWLTIALTRRRGAARRGARHRLRAGRAHAGRAGCAGVVGVYVELIRNTPFIVQLFFIFFGLPQLGVKLSPELASVLAMVVNLGAYAAEIVRAGIEATPRGQIEAGAQPGADPAAGVPRVVLPPALEQVWPALVSQIIIVMLGSAVCGQISTQELSYAANLIQSAQLPRLRGLHRRHADLPGAGGRAAAAASHWVGRARSSRAPDAWSSSPSGTSCATCCWPRAGRWCCR